MSGLGNNVQSYALQRVDFLPKIHQKIPEEIKIRLDGLLTAFLVLGSRVQPLRPSAIPFRK